MKKSPIDRPPSAVASVMTNPPRAPATMISQAWCSGSAPVRNSSSRRLLNVPSRLGSSWYASDRSYR